MVDRLLQLSANPSARTWVKRLGLPIPMPTPLKRNAEAYHQRPLEGSVVVCAEFGDHTKALATTLARAGASTFVFSAEQTTDTTDPRQPYKDAAEAFGRPLLTELGDKSSKEGRVHALVFDGSALTSPEDLGRLYTFFHRYLPRLSRNGRVVVLGPRPMSNTGMIIGALDGFVRSLAKELGRKGSTANLVLAPSGAGAHLEGVLRFLLTERSAFVSAQPIEVSASRASLDLSFVRSLDQKRALVTGAARGIGRAIAQVLAREGARVLCLDRPGEEKELARLADEIGGSFIALDVTDPEAGARLLEELGEEGIDLVIHNAGVTRDRTLAKMKQDAWDLVLNVNLKAILDLTEELSRSKALRSGGRVVILSSVAGLAGNPGQTNYAASKGAIAGWVRGMSSSFGRRRITLNAVAPGFIETQMTGKMPAAIREGARRLSALGQGGQPEDVAEAVLFFTTPHAAAITGQVLRVCGGALIGA